MFLRAVNASLVGAPLCVEVSLVSARVGVQVGIGGVLLLRGRLALSVGGDRVTNLLGDGLALFAVCLGARHVLQDLRTFLEKCWWLNSNYICITWLHFYDMLVRQRQFLR